MSVETRWVVLDGSSSAFEFNGDWKEESVSQGHLSTLQTTTENGSVMRFTFNGSEVTMFGETRVGGSGSRPTVNCTVDGEPTTSDPRATGDGFACVWYGQEGDNRPHTLVLNTTIPQGSPSAAVSIDSLWFHPTSDSRILEDDPAMLVMYDHNDPHIQLSAGDWETYREEGAIVSMTGRRGASLSVSFTGTRLDWEGWRVDGFGTERSTGTYSIDGGPPITFNLDPPGPSAGKGIKYVRIRNLSPGLHNLTVVYDGPGIPLTLDHLLVGGGNIRIEPLPTSPTTPILPSASSTTSLVAPGSSSSSSPQPSQPIGAIVGGVVGGLAVILLALLALLLVRRKRAQKRRFATEAPSIQTPPSEQSSSTRALTDLVSPLGVQTPHSPSSTANAASSGQSNRSLHDAPPSATVYRKDQESESSTPPQNATDMSEIHQHQDSGVRMHRTSLPPVYTQH